MSDRSDLLFLIEEAKTRKSKSKSKSKIDKNPPPHHNTTRSILFRFNRYKEEHLATIQKRIKLTLNGDASRSSILNADMAYKNNMVELYPKIRDIGEIVIKFDSLTFSIIDIKR